MEKENVVTPWEVKGDVNYNKILKEFGTTIITDEMTKKLQKCHPLLRRKIYFSHRDFDKWLSNAASGKKISVLTGRGPSENMHLGHLVPYLVAKSLQDVFGCEVFIPISDDEKFFVKKDLTFEQTQKYSEENILDLIALGFDPKKTFIFQDFVYTDIYKYAAKCAKRITYSTAKSVFGLTPENNIGWSFYPAMQAAHILFPLFIRGSHLTVVPVGIDQDPFIRITRDIAKSFNFEKPAGLYSKFIPSLHGSPKMSSSKDGNIWLSDTKDQVKNKINKYAFSGGQSTLEEHRKKGGNPDIDVCYQYLRMLLEEDDNKLSQIYNDYKSGKLTSGDLKKLTIEKINNFLEKHQIAREKAKKRIGEFIYK